MNKKFYKIAGLSGVIFVIFLILLQQYFQSRNVYVGKPIKAPFEIADNQSLDIPDGLGCEDVISPFYAYTVYQSVQSDLERGVTPSEVSYIECFMPKAAGAETAHDALARFTSTVFLPDVLFGYLEAGFENRLRLIVRVGDAREGSLAWRSKYLGQAAFEGFKATNETRFLDLYIKFFDRLMLLRDSELGYRDDYHGKIMASWGATNLDKKPEEKPLWISHVTHFSITMIPATGFAREIKSSPELAAYLPWANKVLDFFEVAYLQFDVDLRPVEGTNEQWYWRPLLDKYEATNHVHMQGQALLNAYAATGNPIYKDRIEKIIRIFEKAANYHDDGSVSWHYSPYFQVSSASKDDNNRQYAEFSRKGSFTIPFLFEAEKDGLLNNNKLMDALTLTIKDYIVGDGAYKVHTHPFKAKGPTEMEAGMKFYSISGYLYAANRDPDIGINILDIITSQPENYIGGWFGHRAMARSYGYFLRPDKG